MAKAHSMAALVLGILSFTAAVGCTSAQPPAMPDTRAADEAMIRKTDADWVTAAQTKKVDAWMAFYSDDAVALPPNDKVANTKEAIHKAVGDMLGLPGLSLHWKPTGVEVARSGDIAYLYGAYELTMNDAKGKPVTDHGKMLEVWKKQADGNWKCAVDTWNSDTPAPPPSR